MAEQQTLARPYAKAIFRLAKEAGSYQEWEDLLHLLVTIVAEQQVIKLIKSPMVSVADKVDFVIDVGAKRINQQGQEFVRLLAEYNRLLLIPAIQSLYEQYRAEEEQTIEVEVCSAIELQTKQKGQLQLAIGKYFNKKVALQWQQDPNLIGGFVVKAKDKVFDGSVRGQLQALHRELISH